MFYHNILKTFLLGLSFLAISCSDEGNSTSSTETSHEVDSIYELGRCSEERLNETIFVTDKQENYICKDNGWTPEYTNTERSSSSIVDEISCSSRDNHSSSSSENQKKSSSSTTNEAKSSSSSNKEAVVTSSENQKKSSSSTTNEAESSSSSNKEMEESSSSEAVTNTLEDMLASRSWMWNGSNGNAEVEISENEKSPWLVYGDADLGGRTSFTWDNAINWYGFDTDRQAVADLSSYCQSICGTANLVESGVTDGAGNYYAGIGFQMSARDISDWNGFTVIYSSDIDLTLGIEESHRSSYEYDDYRATLPATEEPKMITISWEYFAQSGVGTPQPLERILQSIQMIDLQYFSKTAVQTKFKIYAIGKNN